MNNKQKSTTVMVNDLQQNKVTQHPAERWVNRGHGYRKRQSHGSIHGSHIDSQGETPKKCGR